MATVQISSSISEADPKDRPVVIVGQVRNLKKVSWDSVQGKLNPRVSAETFNQAVGSLHPSPTDSCSLWLKNATLAALPREASRHNTPSRAHALTKLVRSCVSGCSEECILVVCEKSDVFASACAVSRAFPHFSRKSSASQRCKIVVEFLVVDGVKEKTISESEAKCLQAAADAVRLTAKIVDTPCNDMNTDDFLNEIKSVGSQVGITPVIIRGEELKELGFGGIYGVGQAAEHPPALAVLSHKPAGATQTVAWVGKGIVYDTGGLSIKGKTAMPGMKRDCGGAAAVLGAFYAAVHSGFQDNLHAVFCLAENAVGPRATRPDDIHKLYSGRTVEINNTDAEGRLVLGDGVAYASKDLQADIIVDVATLTGAQGISVGKYHAAILSNNEQWEQACVTAGQKSGDLVHPLPYCPELHFSEFNSAVADSKNSVADRNNAQSSCAGLFIGSHLGFDWPGVWLHVDMAAPAHVGERATGYGVALMLALFGRASETALLQAVSPLGPVQDQQGDGVVGNAHKKRKLV